MTQAPFADLVGAHKTPVLVVGAGVKALDDLSELGPVVSSALVISANAHAFRIPHLKPRYIVSKDHMHTELKTPMQDVLRPYGAPVISRQWWADYRLTNWCMQGNSGLHAIAVAVAIGGHPVIPVGFDFFQAGTYWYAADAPNVSRGKGSGDIVRRVSALKGLVEGACVRPVSGPLLRFFPAYRADEPLLVPRETLLTALCLKGGAVKVRAIRETCLGFDPRARIPPGAEFLVSAGERRQLKDSVVECD